RVRNETKNPAGRGPPPDSDPFGDVEFVKNPRPWQDKSPLPVLGLGLGVASARSAGPPWLQRSRVDKTLSNIYPVSAYATSLSINSAGGWRFGVTTYRLCDWKGGHWRLVSCDGLQTARSVESESETLHLNAKPVCHGRRPGVDGCSG